jgi:hypothetical protein
MAYVIPAYPFAGISETPAAGAGHRIADELPGGQLMKLGPARSATYAAPARPSESRRRGYFIGLVEPHAIAIIARTLSRPILR